MQTNERKGMKKNKQMTTNGKNKSQEVKKSAQKNGKVIEFSRERELTIGTMVAETGFVNKNPYICTKCNRRIIKIE